MFAQLDPKFSLFCSVISIFHSMILCLFRELDLGTKMVVAMQGKSTVIFKVSFTVLGCQFRGGGGGGRGRSVIVVVLGGGALILRKVYLN